MTSKVSREDDGVPSLPLEKMWRFEPSILNEIYVWYDKTYKASKVYIQSLQNICVCQDVKLDQDARSPKP